MSIKAQVTPEVIKWARTTARISTEDAALYLKINPSVLEAWEEGSLQPTIRQAERLAKYYRRSFALFFLPKPPNELGFQPLKDFRTPDALPLTTASIFMIREIQEKQSWMRLAMESDHEIPLEFIGRHSIMSDPKIVAADILATLNIDNVHPDGKLKEWITKAEQNRICVCKTSFLTTRKRLNKEELKGFAISDPFAPFIFINTNDWPKARLFTFVHELVHLWINQSGISNQIGSNLELPNKFDHTELFCNEVVGYALMSDQAMTTLPSDTFHNIRNVYREAQKLGVSSYSLLVRAYKGHFMIRAKYPELVKRAHNEYKLYLEKKEEVKKKVGGPNPYLLKFNRGGLLFTSTVINAYRNGTILPVEASRLLNTQVNRFSKFDKYLTSTAA